MTTAATMHDSPFNMRQYNLNVLRPPISKPGTVSSSTLPKPPMSYKSAAQSLDLLRQNIQRSINQEIQTVISKYIDMFFKPGIENIRNNLGPDSVTDDHIKGMCRTILEEAKGMYPVYAITNPSQNCKNRSAIDGNDIDYQNSHSQNQIKQEDTKPPITSPSVSSGVKRESDTDSEASSLSNASKKTKKSGNKSSSGNNNSSNNGSANSSANGSSSNSSSSSQKPKKPSGPSRKHVAMWDTTKLNPETLFIMGAKANKALGFAQTRGRLYVKHPGLFKYASDADDKEWLSKNKLMPATGGRAYIMLLEDIEKLARDNKLNVTINYEDIKGFRVPDFILEKMKSYIGELKKQHAEEAPPKPNTIRKTNNNANTNATSNANNEVRSNQPNAISSMSATPPVPNTSINSSIATSNSTGETNNCTTTFTTLNPPLLPPMPHHQQQQASMQQQQQQQPPPPPQQQQQHNPHVQPNLQSYQMHVAPTTSAPVIYEQSFPPPPAPHDMEYMHIDKPPPMYPGHSNQQQHPQMPQMANTAGGYPHPTHIDPIEQALSKGDWSGVSDRSLLQYALQSSRNIGSWDPQDSFDLIESVTNGGLGSGGSMDEASPLLQISPDAGAHLSAPSLGPVSPSCELSAVLDQAFQYTDT